MPLLFLRRFASVALSSSIVALADREAVGTVVMLGALGALLFALRALIRWLGEGDGAGGPHE
jgi:hypothetical protein